MIKIKRIAGGSGMKYTEFKEKVRELDGDIIVEMHMNSLCVEIKRKGRLMKMSNDIVGLINTYTKNMIEHPQKEQLYNLAIELAATPIFKR